MSSECKFWPQSTASDREVTIRAVSQWAMNTLKMNCLAGDAAVGLDDS